MLDDVDVINFFHDKNLYFILKQNTFKIFVRPKNMTPSSSSSYPFPIFKLRPRPFLENPIFLTLVLFLLLSVTMMIVDENLYKRLVAVASHPPIPSPAPVVAETPAAPEASPVTSSSLVVVNNNGKTDNRLFYSKDAFTCVRNDDKTNNIVVASVPNNYIEVKNPMADATVYYSPQDYYMKNLGSPTVFLNNSIQIPITSNNSSSYASLQNAYRGGF